MISEVFTSTPPVSPEAYRLADDVLFIRLEDGSARLMDLSGDVYVLSETAARMLTGCLSGDPEATWARLATEHGVPTESVHADAKGLLSDLVRAGVVLPRGISAPRNRRAPLAAVLAASLRLCLRRRSAGGLVTLAHVSTHVLGWAQTVRVWMKVVEQTEARMPADPLTAIEEATRRAIAHHPLDVGCKERALCAYALARRSGWPARLVLGAYPFPFTSHVWCESGSHILADRYEDGCDLYTPVLTYEEGHQW
jgi:transglutaminase superfamily protein/coenzyme PQQ synthesis protein D (PqqD)